MLGVLSLSSVDSWVVEMSILDSEYNRLKRDCLPDLNKVQSDPLTSLHETGVDEEWSKYYKVKRSFQCIYVFVDVVFTYRI